MNLIKAEIIKLVKGHLNLSLEEIEPCLERPAETKRGDYALACFRWAKELQKLPADFARQIADKLKPTGFINRLESVGGYVNFFVDTTQLVPLVLKQILSEKDKYGSSEIGPGKTIVIDYSSPNIAKPMGIGHLRSTVIGHALYNIYKTLGYQCVGINYLGDWGTQFGMLIADYKENRPLYETSQLTTSFLNERYILFNERTKTEADLIKQAQVEFKKLESGDAENNTLWEKLRETSIKEFHRVYKLLDVSFDEYSGESEATKYVDQTIAGIEKKGLSEISEGALIVDLKQYGMQPCLLKKSDGATLYAARDIAMANHRYDKYKFHKLLYVVGSDQKLHFRQFFKVLELMGCQWAKDCVHIDFGLVRMGGEKMSTRRGKTILLEEVLNEAIARSKKIMGERLPAEASAQVGAGEMATRVSADKADEIARAVGIGAIIFNDLKNRRTRDIDFDWEQVLSFDGETGPYLQYTHTRLVSLLEKARESGYEITESADKVNLLKTDEEIDLIKVLSRFPEIIEESASEYEPSIISNYLLKLASIFNRFYRFHRVISDDRDLTQARLVLVVCLKYVLAKGLTLLGIKPLEEM